MKSRSAIEVTLFTLLTCGIYGIYWMLANNRDAREYTNFDTRSGILL